MSLNEVSNFIKKLKPHIYGKIELECTRLINKNNFNILISILKSIYKYETEKYTTKSFKEKRIIQKGRKNKFEIKEKFNINIDKIHNFKFNLKLEKNTKPFKPNKMFLIRNIYRHNFNTKYFIISLSQVNTSINSLLKKYTNISFDKFQKMIFFFKKDIHNISDLSHLLNFLNKDGFNELQYELNSYLEQNYDKHLTSYEMEVEFRKEYQGFDVITDFLKLLDSIISRNKPHDLHIENFTYSNLIQNPYFVSVKADGIRSSLYLENNIILFDNNRFVNLGTYYSKPILLDVEVVNDIIYIFDILVYNGIIITQLPFEKRLNCLSNIELPISSKFDIKLKEHIKLDVDKSFISIYDLLNTNIDNDGLIFTPSIEPYLSPNIFKWKPIEKLTIDLKILENGYGVSKKGKVIKFNVPFKLIKNDINFNIGDIVEFKLKDNNLIPYRNRTEDGSKFYPNKLEVVKDIMKIYRNPITENIITGQDSDLILMRKYHNKLKSNIYKTLNDNGVVDILDIGSGRGGDIPKWKKYGFLVTCVEPNSDNYKEFKRRLKFDDFKCKLIEDKFENVIVEKQFDAITMFNSITFFFRNQLTANDLLCKLKNGTYIQIMGFDVNKFKQSYPNGFEDESRLIRYENGKVFIDMKGTIVRNQIEYQVDYDYIINYFSDYELLEDYYLDSEKLLNDFEYIYSSCTRQLLFKKK